MTRKILWNPFQPPPPVLTDEVAPTQERPDFDRVADYAAQMDVYRHQLDAYRYQTETETRRVGQLAEQLAKQLAKQLAEQRAEQTKRNIEKETSMPSAQICTIFKVKNGFTANMTGGSVLIGSTLIELCEAIKAQVAEEALMRPAKSEDDEEKKFEGQWAKLFK